MPILLSFNFVSRNCVQEKVIYVHLILVPAFTSAKIGHIVLPVVAMLQKNIKNVQSPHKSIAKKSAKVRNEIKLFIRDHP